MIARLRSRCIVPLTLSFGDPMHHVTRLPFVLVLITGLLAVAAAARAQSPSIDDKADAALRRMSTTLAAAKSFSFEAHSIADQVLPDGQKVQTARNQKVLVRRPDRIH